jgi:hypothetical protein
MDKAAGRYDSANLLTCLDGAARYLAAHSQEAEIVLFLDDIEAVERLGGWQVQVAPVPDGDADAAIRAYASSHADRPQILVSGDQALCGDVALWGTVCLSPESFVSRYLVPANRSGYIDHELPTSYVEASDDVSPAPQTPPLPASADWGEIDRQRQATALARVEAMLRGELTPRPGVYRLALSRWADESDLALYLAEHHLCSSHSDLNDPREMIAAIRGHCSHQPRYFTAGRVIDRLFRLFLCRPEHTQSLDDLAHRAKTRRRKVKAALERYGEQLGIVAVW